MQEGRQFLYPGTPGCGWPWGYQTWKKGAQLIWPGTPGPGHPWAGEPWKEVQCLWPGTPEIGQPWGSQPWKRGLSLPGMASQQVAGTEEVSSGRWATAFLAKYPRALSSLVRPALEHGAQFPYWQS